MRVGILTISDRSASGERDDLSGPAIEEVIAAQEWLVERREILADDFPTLKKVLANWADEGGLDVILTTGGTGFGPRDVTPEATMAVLERITPGLTEAMRAASLAITPHAMLSRAVAGIRGNTLIVNLPGSPKGAIENLKVILPVLQHAVDLLGDDPGAEAGHSRFGA